MHTGLVRIGTKQYGHKLTRVLNAPFMHGPIAWRMPFTDAPYDAHTIGLMTAALETAWMAARLGVPNMSDQDRLKMQTAISNAVASGERGFTELQQAAFDAVGATTAQPVDRRKQLRLVGTDRRRR